MNNTYVCICQFHDDVIKDKKLQSYYRCFVRKGLTIKTFSIILIFLFSHIYNVNTGLKKYFNTIMEITSSKEMLRALETI